MSLEGLMCCHGSLDWLREFIGSTIQSVRDCDPPALSTLAVLLALFVWYCYHVGREQQPRPYATVLQGGVEVAGLQNGFSHCRSPECVRCAQSDGLNQKLYHNLQEYAKRYSWAGMGRIHKGIREQGRYLTSRPSIQRPEVFFLPDLPTTPYFSREAQKHDVELLERNFQTILCEFESLYKAFSNCSLPDGWKVNSTPSGLKTPSSCELVVGGEPQCWAEGRCLIFDDSFLHTAYHGGKSLPAEDSAVPQRPRERFPGLPLPCGQEVPQVKRAWVASLCPSPGSTSLLFAPPGSPEEGPRAVFMVDLWHPNVAAAERQALDFIFAPGR
ncbi:aspartate beta-hydroxylase domain-containing protein 2-like isoform X3 [Pantherophis guttatus]|uniref:Aspartate beta-hydroxylase domain-containing protein 2 isoform X3 n=1 Tax=Pantherophis guttatus TaxID=94885 RepID=A0A6P9CNS7_PANGU|nr:aspartate beta-hydroxylase domain-containing protein 2 isoform X3 [Pantherophis guttatus]XP_060538181.1 aspartate beta-hydroxylase domain-containing protein 2-like isoform X3 [Pantherophis guttatus]